METPPKVLMTADAVGGVWTYAIDLAAGLREHGIGITFAVLGPGLSDSQRASAESIPGLRLLETGLTLDWTAESRTEVKEAGRGLAAIATEAGCDLIHLNSPALAADARFPCPVIAVCHSCVSTWWTAVRGSELPADFKWRADLVRAGYEAADLLLAPSAAFARDTAETYELPDLPRVVHNGRAARSKSAAVGGSAEPFVLTAGRLWDDGKNIAMLDRIAGRLRSPVLAAGSTQGPHGAAIVLRHAQVLGHVDAERLDELLAVRPIFASLALYEPFGLAVLEAAQAGCPLVLSDIPTFRELWEGAALFVDPRGEEAAAIALARLLADPAERDRLGRAAEERASCYAVTRMVEGVAASYRDILASKGGRADLMTAA